MRAGYLKKICKEITNRVLWLWYIDAFNCYFRFLRNDNLIHGLNNRGDRVFKLIHFLLLFFVYFSPCNCNLLRRDIHDKVRFPGIIQIMKGFIIQRLFFVTFRDDSLDSILLLLR